MPGSKNRTGSNLRNHSIRVPSIINEYLTAYDIVGLVTIFIHVYFYYLDNIYSD